MKKLMFAAVAATVAGGAFAIPTVYDYKANVKYVYLKNVTISANIVRAATGVNVAAPVYQKIQKSASLKGYLIMDSDGATSQTIVNDNGDGNSNPATGFDYGRNRGFLVVQNSKAERSVRFPKIIPAVLDAKWFDTAWSKAHRATSGIAEGVLFAGGDAVAPVRTQLDALRAGVTDRGAAPVPPAVATPGMAAYADYLWTSVYLFGEMNGPNWYVVDRSIDPGTHAFQNFEAAWDANLPADLQTGLFGGATYNNQLKNYHDTWLNGAGIGKWSKAIGEVAGEFCCGIDEAGGHNDGAPILETLSGNLKGGVWLCTENGILARKVNGMTNLPYSFWDDAISGTFHNGTSGWDDQFVTVRLAPGLTFADSFQNDMWQDGPIEQETSDVVYGTWSIKRNRNFFAARNPIYRAPTVEEIQAITQNPAAIGQEDATGLTTLVGSIKGAALKLNNRANFVDGRETAIDMTASNQFSNWPLITPKFAKYYGLANFL